MAKTYIGIDIGKQGAIAIIRPSGEIDTYKMPMIKTELDYHGLGRLIKEECETTSTEEGIHISFEKLGVIFGSSKQTAWSMGEQSGAIEMICICQNIPYTKVRAVDWQKTMFQGLNEITKPSKTGGKPSRDTKAMALVGVKRLFPTLKLTFGEKAKVPDDGLIDAVLIAEYSRRNNF